MFAEKGVKRGESLWIKKYRTNGFLSQNLSPISEILLSHLFQSLFVQLCVLLVFFNYLMQICTFTNCIATFRKILDSHNISCESRDRQHSKIFCNFDFDDGSLYSLWNIPNILVLAISLLHLIS